ncbi:parathyroid hormone/parathyroid hormone-related peptide receptor-like [Mya arenaria]|uniref:parathyroid hormone/parathyroid hormone-related peptide receptor-like n=1 Tax=Mya arenaria TaxID=6604 RepID=UPI0022E19836|nr:parathyroid hormone/parathyroid hormone-related peptide receptor-like [Mya arenaria]XP_052804556.1 parathyroid hormone/parathyroid hormone-related peptide receptor-like [Mya arenaria]XP_052804561.1 parathyroid hormone/parathyroid hormone-related peptide receptor-like [Mya arenaria]
MAYQIDQEVLLKAEQQCMKRLEQYTPTEGFCNMTWDLMLCWEEAPAGTLVKNACPSHVKDISQTGFALRECGLDGIWVHPDDGNTTTGWTNYTDCFKEDADFASITNDLTRINLMANIGYAISLVSLVVAVLIMLISRRLHCKSNSLHLNLFTAFILRAVCSLFKDVLFVEGLGLEKDVIQLSEDKFIFNEGGGTHWECKLLVTLFMYALSASMMWIFMEGLYLHMLVYKTLFTERTGIRMYVIIGWLSPLVYVIPWILVKLYADNSLCWNIDEHGFNWIIMGPIILTIVLNFIFFINIVRVLCIRMKSHRNITNKSSNQQIRYLAKFALVLIPLFGVLYIVTLAYPVGIDIRADMIYLYWDMFYNSFQGFLLAVLFCFLNEEVHNEIRRCCLRHRRSDNLFTRTFTLSTYRKGSAMSHTSHVHINSGVRGNKRNLLENDNNVRLYTNNQDAISSSSSSGRKPGVQKSVRYHLVEDNDQVFPTME